MTPPTSETVHPLRRNKTVLFSALVCLGLVVAVGVPKNNLAPTELPIKSVSIVRGLVYKNIHTPCAVQIVEVLNTTYKIVLLDQGSIPLLTGEVEKLEFESRVATNSDYSSYRAPFFGEPSTGTSTFGGEVGAQYVGDLSDFKITIARVAPRPAPNVPLYDAIIGINGSADFKVVNIPQNEIAGGISTGSLLLKP